MEKKKTMKRIDAIVKGKHLTDVLFGLRKKRILRAIEAAHDSAEAQKEEASLEYDKLLSSLAEDDCDYQKAVKKMLEHKQTIISADATLTAIEEIRADLDAEVEVVD